MKFNAINKIIIIGGSFIVKEFIEEIKKQSDLEIMVFCAKRHLEELMPDISLKNYLIKNKIVYYQSDDINNDRNFVEEITKNTMGLAMGAPWVFDKKTVGLFAKDHLLDFMNIDLPRYLGGAHYTWRMLNQNKKGGLNMQIISGGADSFQKGGIIKRQNFDFSADLAEPLDGLNFSLKKETKFLKDFLKEARSGKDFKIAKLNEKKSSHYPFLSTEINGFVNWAWSGKDIFLFIKAFDRPYGGAATFLNGQQVFLRNVQLLKSPEIYHPFTSGIIMRRNKEGIFVATVGNLLQIKTILNKKRENIINFIEPGSRLYTPLVKIDQAMLFQAAYNSKGLKRKKVKP